ncbi:hypothetical protein CC86DRAFT_213937 [Ophiobolus disseminans]|uniref:Cell wall protein PhiA n=1 Tax=Ophiobolus disseminans TaxID=1469910 RepID=A0A6A7A3C1_9PLEO|nr:hypothetical protein CC86DRAFT_213937 [Ophiobolus disseminans]
MKFTTTALIASTAALAAASPCKPTPTENPKAGDIFRIMALRSASDIHFQSVQALRNGFLINAPAQNASCSRDVNYASFILQEDGDLYLNTRNPPQQAFVDRSGMGQGVIQYTTGVQGIGRNQERGPFKINSDSNLVFVSANGEETGFQACPNALGGGYSVWLAGATNPGGNKDCIGFSARALKESDPVTCAYTTS